MPEERQPLGAPQRAPVDGQILVGRAASPLARSLAPLICVTLLQWVDGRTWGIAVYLIVLSVITVISVWLAGETHRSELWTFIP
jgi:MFS transporter, MHS family, shikimate and dehydroshikimate transport protein